MQQDSLDALIVCGNQYAGFEGAVLYTSGFEIVHRHVYVLIPLEGEPTLVFPREARWIGDKQKPWVKDQVWPDLPGQWLRERATENNWKRIAVYGMNFIMAVRDYRELARGPFELVAFDREFDIAGRRPREFYRVADELLRYEVELARLRLRESDSSAGFGDAGAAGPEGAAQTVIAKSRCGRAHAHHDPVRRGKLHSSRGHRAKGSLSGRLLESVWPGCDFDRRRQIVELGEGSVRRSRSGPGICLASRSASANGGTDSRWAELVRFGHSRVTL